VTIEVDHATLVDLIRDGFSMCLNCDGTTDHIPVDALNQHCDQCGSDGLSGMDALLAEGVIVVPASA
jgi:hypothetical protein